MVLRTYATGSTFAGYRIDALIGRGGMGEVYRAENPRLGTWVALKLLAVASRQHGSRERFIREARAAASLNHPHVIPVFDVDEFEGVPYIAMRYIEGGDLKTLIQAGGALTLERAIALLAPIAAALDWAHAQGIVHRDVKPANILIEEGRAGRDAHVYLSDFGVAKTSVTRGLTKANEFVGTIEYVAPEQIAGKPLDGHADIYALGCILFECLSGEVPFDRDSSVSMMYAHLEEPPPRLSERSEAMPAELDEVIMTALAKSPVDRYPTGSALIAAVDAVAQGKPAPRTMPTVVSMPVPLPETEAPAPPAGATVIRSREEPEPRPTPPPPPIPEPDPPPESPASETVIAPNDELRKNPSARPREERCWRRGTRRELRLRARPPRAR